MFGEVVGVGNVIARRPLGQRSNLTSALGSSPRLAKQGSFGMIKHCIYSLFFILLIICLQIAQADSTNKSKNNDPCTPFPKNGEVCDTEGAYCIIYCDPPEGFGCSMMVCKNKKWSYVEEIYGN